jgi:hypothetical protein
MRSQPVKNWRAVPGDMNHREFRQYSTVARVLTSEEIIALLKFCGVKSWLEKKGFPPPEWEWLCLF